eukprot:CAMPEP_0184479936 /NCGR_PEP_ID=MMETSP0113_2-20130426/1461_1 /TAXON_ID=91329 /ORGANISM="Norrisiella sphaerica, Strain BC52" /LENGTH=171 /DNA_ID=CAMNT_0026858111 /DNA_START=26 /DNA_END=541 /DNA_ORIENTATION=+
MASRLAPSSSKTYAPVLALALVVFLSIITYFASTSVQANDLALAGTRTMGAQQFSRAVSLPSRNVFAFAEEGEGAKKAPVFINKFKKPDSPVRIRLSRGGKHKAPFYRIVVQDSRRIPQGRFLENVGFYDPLRSTGKVSLNIERIKYWVGVGAKPSQTVARFLELVGIQTA